ncbi:geranylgeranyl diphosphate synthase, chloroplast precursor [Cyanidioschyzon merolae strain 10D]|jgi:geranylgeranyl diphosphate synthase type II|uniref:Geranylgeranyl diphosphate synthase, chloroplast n=1 Tax=Cyanidioschyzon merolae (strain NIES-3377 / 10D) TaxID=280699 RepID=M1US29_CYAM1|nr:geranylgeranyl diphosphate synthase, chloroplast precursor [Cyanidioschyzon merolae strain 10D]BAM80451.1 geranylgeranyl diphosphate synthase, chloroplast precursor [Cyanidioschyzon merolae strain 10D]|eukprot:XP_005536487.1 geranylgeranyl diphosphate synthase, chloroplast precursor [Cyanidioschyzon merolae strain 10D]
MTPPFFCHTFCSAGAFVPVNVSHFRAQLRKQETCEELASRDAWGRSRSRGNCLHGKNLPSRHRQALLLLGTATAGSSAEVRHGSPKSRTTEAVEFLLAKRASIDAALNDAVQATSVMNARLAEAMRYSLLAGGKRVRPALVLAACRMFGGVDEQAMPTAVAVEMVHTMSLIHDDLPAMDNDDFRRGRPTNHKVYGEEVAILAGDALLSEAFSQIAEKTPATLVPPSRTLEVIRRLGNCVGLHGLAAGQALDLEAEGKPADEISLRMLETIHLYKTAALLRFSITAGAILAGASVDDIDCMESFANKIGLAFQVADDVLDVTATTETLGKTAGKDVAAEKATFPRILGLEESRKYAEDLVKEAKGELAKYGDRASLLLGFADFIIQRAS